MKRKTTEEFIKECRAKHGDKYDYSKVEYTDAKTKVCIICPEHGEFWQRPTGHLKGRGCKKCANEQSSINYTWTTEQFIKKALSVHGKKYDYSKVKYIKGSQLITIGCKTHGFIKLRACKHIEGQGCRECSYNRSVPYSGFKDKGIQYIPLTQGKYAIIDEEDYEKVSKFTWNFSTLGYATTHDGLKMHRLVMSAPNGSVIDHIDHNKLDNRKKNLRVCTNAENQYNKLPTIGKSKYKGVTKHACGKWRVRISKDRKRYSLGLYDTEIEAAKAYDKAAREYFKEFAYLNFGE